jgi:hypothetical protein
MKEEWNFLFKKESFSLGSGRRGISVWGELIKEQYLIGMHEMFDNIRI